MHDIIIMKLQMNKLIKYVHLNSVHTKQLGYTAGKQVVTKISSFDESHHFQC